MVRTGLEGPRPRRGVRAAALAAVSALLAVALGAPPARAELNHPRQAWMRDATAGLFLHWGLRTNRGDPAKPAFKNTDCAAWEAEVTDSGWKPDTWVHAAQQLHAQ